MQIRIRNGAFDSEHIQNVAKERAQREENVHRNVYRAIIVTDAPTLLRKPHLISR